MPLKTRLRVSDVYNDSDSDSDNESINEESPPPSHQASKSPEVCRKTDSTVCATVLPKHICVSLYLLVQLFCKSGKKNYSISVCEGAGSERYGSDGNIKVHFLTTIDGKCFTEIVNDISDVQCEDIIAKLEAPEKNTDGNIMFMEFLANIDVFEKK
ncbi:hypothetical protein TNCT_671301 [Trichonephila clavata]|uniref:Uncharacterized protein n=1 Tax=Trichonephila clavata TaxID=2740835 RepID=A0A8X6F6B4_TRICU|nr:hypothetical protein TNCT_671301 [Trichonephila clavata]